MICKYYKCSGLTSIVVQEGNPTYDSRGNCNAIIKTASNELIAGCNNTEIPNSVTSIGGRAFYYCSGLTSITIPNSVTSIEDEAFYGCGLTSVTIPNSVTNIGEYVFWGCEGLTSITIGNSVTSIGNSAISGCRSLTSIVIQEGNPTFDSRGNCNAIIETASNTLIVGCKNTEIPSSVTNIGAYAFYGCDLTSVTIPNSVTNIGEYAFFSCNGLTSVTCYAKEVPTTDNSAFIYLDLAKFTLYVPEESLETYSLTTPWSNFGTIVALPQSSYILTYMVDGEEYKSYEVEVGASITPEAYPTKDGYTFSGWSEIPSAMPSHDVVVTGRFYTTENVLKVNSKEVCLGRIAILPVEMLNKGEITAFEFELYLPDGITLEDCELTSRQQSDHKCSFTKQADGKYKVAAYSGSSKAFSGSEGALINLMLEVSKDLEVGDYTISVKNIELTLTDSSPVIPADISATLTAKKIKAGDANGDGKVSISDVVAIVNHIIGKTPANFVAAAADVNGDGNINVFDVTKAVNMVLGIYEEAKMRDAVVNEAGLMTMGNDADGMNLIVEKPANYVAMQFDVIVPDGSSLQDVKLNGCADHAVAFDRTGENRYTVIAYSMNNAAFTADALVNIALSDGSKSVSIENAMGVTTDGRCVLMNVMDEATAIATIQSKVDTNAIYNLSGQCVGSDLKTLSKGVYIRNGKKFVVK